MRQTAPGREGRTVRVCPRGGESREGSGRGWRRVLGENLLRGEDLGDPSALLTILSMKVNIQGQRKAALTHTYIKNKSLNYLSSFAWGPSFYVPARLRSISVRRKSYSPLGYVCGVVKNTDARLTGCGTRQLIELVITESDLFLISNYVHLGCAGDTILVLMMAPVLGLCVPSFGHGARNQQQQALLDFTLPYNESFRIQTIPCL